MTPLAQDILAALPQTQCTRCGYPDCAAYAQAVANSEADINQCPPGGQEGVARLAVLTGQTAKPLNPVHGVEGPRSTVFIDEDWCIGCTLCIKACPVDAIVGANKLMHTVIEAHCTGCELCLPVCPVDCIRVENASGTETGWAAWSQVDANKARDRYAFHSYRLNQDEGLNEKELETTAPVNRTHPAPASEPVVPDKKRAVIEAALARARAKRETSPAP